jgi:hypothetical protein
VQRWLAPGVLAVLAIVLLATAVPGVFTIDEDSYIATVVGLRDGTLRIENTAGLPPSPELLSFDAAPKIRTISETPVAPNFPPLYAVFAVVFSFAGIRGLIALQVFAFVVCAYLVFAVVRRETKRTDLAWLALGAYVLGSFAIEYAQAVWPHALAMALVMGAVDLLSRLRHGDVSARRVVIYAAIAGVCIGCAAGVRYQNIVLVLLVGATLLWVPRRRLAIAGYVLGCAIPILTSAAMNASRLGTWNPVSKGSAQYLDVGRARSTGAKVEDAFVSTWARVVDLSAWPGATHSQGVPQSVSGAYLLVTGMKKALLQSAPWALLPLFAVFAAWFRRERSTERAALRGYSVIVAGVLGLFAAWGFRDDGWSFNQRYLLELMPILCVALAISLADWKPSWRVFGAGVAGGIALAAAIIAVDESIGGQIAMLKLPIAIAAAVTIAYVLRNRRRAYALALAATLGVGLGWAATIHIADDLPASRLLRHSNRHRVEEFVTAVPDAAPAALVAYWGRKDPFGPLHLDRDLVIIDPWIDDTRDTVTLVDLLLKQNRIVYVDLAMPQPLIGAITRGRKVQRSKIPWLVRIVP